MTDTAPLPLDGLTVLAIEQAVAAPFCTSRLADAGARVLKIERPEGDFARRYDDFSAGQSSYFVWLNRGKESVVLDLGTSEGKAELKELISQADVLVQNLKPGALARLGFPVEALRAAEPKLIVCSISGYGDNGPLADRKAYDLLIQAESGLCSITGGPDEPARVGISIVDIATGATAHAAILEALIRRGITGQGADIRISMFDVMADWMAVPLLHQQGGKPPKRIGIAHPSIAPYGVFRTRDGKDILIAVQRDSEWVRLCEIVVEDSVTTRDPRFVTNSARIANRAETDGFIGSAIARLDHDDAIARLARADLAFASLNSVEDLAHHPHLRQITIETEGGPVAIPAPAAIFKGEGDRSYGRVPAIGEQREPETGGRS